MTWTLYRWVWRLEAPLFIGMPPAGTLNRCRLYVPALAVHGAITSELARLNAKEKGIFPDYGKFGHEVGLNCRFTYLYPAEKKRDKFLAWTPEYRDANGLCWHRQDGKECLSDRDFRRRLLDSRPGTAIAPETDSAHEATLRETECINPYWRNLSDCAAKSEPVFLLGYLFLRNNGFRRQLENIGIVFVGGDTRYGLGKLKLEQWDDLSEDTHVFGKSVQLNREDPEIKSEIVFGHALAGNDMKPVKIWGMKEFFRGWEVNKLRNGNLAWTPGSCLENPASWLLDTYGCWIYQK